MDFLTHAKCSGIGGLIVMATAAGSSAEVRCLFLNEKRSTFSSCHELLEVRSQNARISGVRVCASLFNLRNS